MDVGKYSEELEYILDYARNDWVGFHVIVGSATSLIGLDASREQDIEMTLRLVRDILDAGVRPGDLGFSTKSRFVPWDLNNEPAVRRIAAEMSEMKELPIAGDICWFTFPASRKRAVRPGVLFLLNVDALAPA